MNFEDESLECSVPQVVPAAVEKKMNGEDECPRCVVPQVVPAAEMLSVTRIRFSVTGIVLSSRWIVDH